MLNRLRQSVFRVANTSEKELSLLPAFEKSLLPLLSASSFLYAYIIALRYKLYQWRIFKQTRLPVPVISVGNITWGGNGKTPMAEYLAWRFLEGGIPPLLLTRGYGSGDEVRLLESHLQGTRALIGVGSNRVEVAKVVLQKHGVRGAQDILSSIKRLNFHEQHTALHDVSDVGIPKLAPHYRMQPQLAAVNQKIGIKEHKDGLGVILMDDGMQHWRLGRDIDIIMVNAISSFGNGRLLPCGPLREPLEALCRADIVVIHHANLVPPSKVDALKGTLKALLSASAGLICTQMVPHSLGYIQRNTSGCMEDQARKGLNLAAPLGSLKDSHVLCISGIGCPESLTLTLQQLGVLFIERMDFPDHYDFEIKDLIPINQRLSELKAKLDHDLVIVTTEKDYARSSNFFWRFKDYDVYILRSMLEIMDDQNAAADLSNLIARKLQCWTP